MIVSTTNIKKSPLSEYMFHLKGQTCCFRDYSIAQKIQS